MGGRTDAPQCQRCLPTRMPGSIGIINNLHQPRHRLRRRGIFGIKILDPLPPFDERQAVVPSYDVGWLFLGRRSCFRDDRIRRRRDNVRFYGRRRCRACLRLVLLSASNDRCKDHTHHDAERRRLAFPRGSMGTRNASYERVGQWSSHNRVRKYFKSIAVCAMQPSVSSWRKLCELLYSLCSEYGPL